jgi:hypothetical protein
MSYFPTIWSREGRFGVEADLSFNGTNQHLITDGLDLSTDFAISFIASNATYTGTDYAVSFYVSATEKVSVRIFGNQVYFLVATGGFSEEVASTTVVLNDGDKISVLAVKTKTELKLYINGILDNSLTLVTPSLDYDLSAGNFYIGSFDGASDFWEGTLSQIAIYSGVYAGITNSDAHLLHVNGGIVNPLKDRGVIANYPLSQRRYDKILVEKLPYLVGDILAWDTVDQYNHQKPELSPITARHAKMINFTDAELGVATAIGTAVKDFHKKVSLTDVYETPVQPLPEDNIEQDSQLPPLTKALAFDRLEKQYLLAQDTFSIPYATVGSTTLHIKFKTDGQWASPSFGEYLFRFSDIVSGGNNFMMQLIGDNNYGIYLRVANPGTNNSKTFTTNQYGLASLPYDEFVSFTITFKQTGSTTTWTGTWINGAKIRAGATSGSPEGGIRWDLFEPSWSLIGAYDTTNDARMFNGHLIDFKIWSRRLSNREISNLHNNTFFKNPTLNEQKGLTFDMRFDEPTQPGGAGTPVLFTERISGTRFSAEGWGNDLSNVQNSIVPIDELRI